MRMPHFARASKLPTGRPGTRRSLARRLLSATIAVSIAVIAALSATGVTYAMWNGKTTVDGSSVSSGTTSVTINDVSDYVLPALTTSKLLPGRSVVSAPLTVRNTGYTPVSITIGSTVFADPSSPVSSNLLVVVRQASFCEPTAFGTTPASFTTPIVLARGASTQVCVEARLRNDAPASVQGLESTFTITFAAVQVRLP